MTFVLESLAVDADPACRPATLRIGQLGLGNVGSALARLTSQSANHLKPYGTSATDVTGAIP